MKPIMITLNQIKAHEPCKDGWSKAIKANGGTNADMDKLFPVSSILGSNDLEDTLWTLQCLPEYDYLWRKFAWWCASSVSHLTNDERVDACLTTVWDYSEGNATQEDLAAARAAAGAAMAAAGDAAWAAAEAAMDDAWAAAGAAAWATAEAAAWAAAEAAMDDAWAAAWAAAGEAHKQKLKEILDSGEFK